MEEKEEGGAAPIKLQGWGQGTGMWLLLPCAALCVSLLHLTSPR